MKVLALDYGSARTGVAVSDPTGTLARPLEVVENASAPAGLKHLAELAEREGVEQIVVGLPVTLRGERGAQAEETEAFVSALRAVTAVPIESFDERFTTKLAEAQPSEARFRCRRGGPPAFDLPGMEERPPEIRRHRQASSTTRALAALGGLILGIGVLAAIAFAVVGRNSGASSGPATQDTTTGPPPKPVLRIVFPEGFTRVEMADRITAVNKIAEDKRQITPNLSEQEYLRVTKTTDPPAGFPKNVPNLEGFLFPATYDFTEDTTSKELVGDQLEAFDRNWSQIDLKYAKSKNLTEYDVLTIASMIEKEVQVPKERPLVAAVIYNRLHLDMPLGIDATIRYGLNIPPTQAILQSQLETPSPYNTRCCPGIPPTPIGNPGLASMQAAAHPAKVDYLYFVRKADCKSHFFTASLDEFNNYPRGGLDCG